MAIRPIITDGAHKILRGKAKRVGRIDDSIRRLVDDMIDTMREAPGVGLAAPQIGVPLRVIVVEYEDQLYTVINPELTGAGGEATDEEGCLSAPHWQGPVSRATRLVVRGRDRNGKEVRIKADGWLARIFQHEVDHLEGTLFLDRVHDRSTIHWVEPREEEAVVSRSGREAQPAAEGAPPSPDEARTAEQPAGAGHHSTRETEL